MRRIADISAFLTSKKCFVGQKSISIPRFLQDRASSTNCFALRGERPPFTSAHLSASASSSASASRPKSAARFLTISRYCALSVEENITVIPNLSERDSCSCIESLKCTEFSLSEKFSLTMCRLFEVATIIVFAVLPETEPSSAALSPEILSSFSLSERSSMKIMNLSGFSIIAWRTFGRSSMFSLFSSTIRSPFFQYSPVAV